MEFADIVWPGEFKEVEGLADGDLVHVGLDGVVAARVPSEAWMAADEIARIGARRLGRRCRRNRGGKKNAEDDNHFTALGFQTPIFPTLR